MSHPLHSHEWARLSTGYLLIALSSALWLLAPLPWWLPGWAIAERAVAGVGMMAAAELSHYLGLWALGPEEAPRFYRWEALKRVLGGGRH